MATAISNDQFLYTGRGPIDYKAFVKTYNDLTNDETWTNEETVVAYNGMITAVWLNAADVSKNGIYFLHDPACTTALKKPDVTKEANWHKLGEVPVIVETKAELPSTGISDKLYIVTSEATMYVWYNEAYLPVGGSAGESTSATITAITTAEIDALWEDSVEEPEE